MKKHHRLTDNLEAMLLELEPRLRRLNELRKSPNFLNSEEEAKEVLDTLNFWLTTIHGILDKDTK